MSIMSLTKAPERDCQFSFCLLLTGRPSGQFTEDFLHNCLAQLLAKEPSASHITC